MSRGIRSATHKSADSREPASRHEAPAEHGTRAMSLPDPAASRAVLIGTAHYPHDDALEDLNAVTANVIDFERLLRDAVFAAYTKHCMLVYDPETAVDLAKPVDQAATEAEDLLLIYYAGHGLLDKRMALHLGVKRSTRRYTRFDSFDYEGMRELLALSQARKKILILDCCFSGRAIGAMGGDADIATADIDAPGTYILTATSSTKPAHAPPGAEFTAFTKQLLSVLTDGIDDGPELLGLDDVYRTVRSRLMAEGFPEPQRRSTNAASGLDLVQNPALLRDTSDEATPTWDADADEGADELARQESHPEKTIENAPPGTPEDPELKRDHPEIWLALEQAMTLDDLQVLVSASDLGARVAHERLARALVRISDGTGTALAELVGAVVAAERTAEDSRASAAVQAVRDRWSEVETSLREVSAKVAELQVKQDEQIAVEQSVRDKVETLRSNREILRADLGAELASNP